MPQRKKPGFSHASSNDPHDQNRFKPKPKSTMQGVIDYLARIPSAAKAVPGLLQDISGMKARMGFNRTEAQRLARERRAERQAGGGRAGGGPGGGGRR